MPPHEEGWAGAALAAAGCLQRLEPGPLAECGRMDERDGAPVFWRLAARHPETIGHRSRMEQWVTIIRILAILTPKGDPAARHPLHDSNRRLGAVLCDGGDPAWPGTSSGRPSPTFSERRLAQLVAARGSQRAVLLERAARSLVRSRSPNTGVNVIDIAAVLIQPENGRRLAEPYYRRLDRAEQAAKKSEEGAS